MGGPDIEEMKNITPQRIIKTYQKYKTARRTAEVLGITHPTVTKYLKKAGITTYEPGWVSWQELRAGKESFKHSKFAEWLRNNEGVKLPRNIKRISEITKLSKDTIK